MRSFEASSLISTPRLDGATAVTLGVALLNTAKASKLPPACAEATADLAEAHEALCVAVQYVTIDAKLPDAIDVNGAAAAVANAWVTLHTLAKSWTRMPASPERDHAEELLRDVFPRGVSFVRRRRDPLYAESAIRIRRIDEKKLGKQVRSIGAAKMLEHVQSAHQAFGRALVARYGDDFAKPKPSLAAALAGFREALAAFVLQAAALRRKSDPVGTALSARLLAPFAKLERYYQAAKKKAAPKDAPLAPTSTENGGEATKGGSPLEADPRAPAETASKASTQGADENELKLKTVFDINSSVGGSERPQVPLAEEASSAGARKQG